MPILHEHFKVERSKIPLIGFSVCNGFVILEELVLVGQEFMRQIDGRQRSAAGR